jgi:hypothetical protein
MTPAAVSQLKLLDEVLAKIEYKDWNFQCGEIEGAVFFRASYPWRDPFTDFPTWRKSRFRILDERTTTRLAMARQVLEAVRDVENGLAGESLIFAGATVFARGE